MNSSCSCISNTKKANPKKPKRPKQTKSHFAFGTDHSDLRTAGDIHHSSQQDLPITISAAVSVYKHQPPFPVWCTSEIPADRVMGLPNTQSSCPICFNTATSLYTSSATLTTPFPMHIPALTVFTLHQHVTELHAACLDHLFGYH